MRFSGKKILYLCNMAPQLKEILKLSDSEKILLVEQIWDSIDKNHIELTTAQKKELDKRLKEYKEGKMKFVDWETAKKRIRKSL